jgi:hypothetical protein
MDKTLEECEREIFREYQEKVSRLNNQEDGDTLYQLTQIRGGDLKVRVIRQGGKIQHFLSLAHIDRKLGGLVTHKRHQSSSQEQELNKILFDSIQLINKFRHHLKILK